MSLVMFVMSIVFIILFGGLSQTLLWERRVIRPPAAPARAPQLSPNPVKTAMQVIISLVLLGASLYFVFSGSYDADRQKWAFATIGTLIGFWLKG
jgi:hypothetical protein